MLNNLEISDANAKKKNIEVKGHKLMKDNHFFINLENSDASEKKKNIEVKEHKLMEDIL